MRIVTALWLLLVLSACGVESVGTAATVGKLQAEQAKQGKENLDAFKTKLEAATKATEESAKKAAEEADKN